MNWLPHWLFGSWETFVTFVVVTPILWLVLLMLVIFVWARVPKGEVISLSDEPLEGCKDYQEHQNEIHAKLIAIMGDRLSVHIKTLQVGVMFSYLL